MNPETGLPSYPDNHFDLAIVDPPYRDVNAPTNRMRAKRDGKMRHFGKRPTEAYFDELFRVSKNQIVWGANNFLEFLPNTNCMLFWYKMNPAKNYSDGEFAWTSFGGVGRCIPIMHFGAHNNGVLGIHETEKPEILYRWLANTYAKQGDLILDTHVGSASSLIAFEEMGFDYVGFELDADYYRDSCKRIEAFRAQPKLFTGKEVFEASKPPTLF